MILLEIETNESKLSRKRRMDRFLLLQIVDIIVELNI
jgi:hypothetical protein